MAQRMITDAKIVLERAGYNVFINNKIFLVSDPTTHVIDLRFHDSGLVDDDFVCKWLSMKCYNSFGYLTVKDK